MLKIILNMENNSMKILVTGYTGQLGYDVVHEGMKRGFKYDWYRFKRFRYYQ